ncbi:unnamed protein product [Linum tenue]|uniref:DNL-type domain-containing protein n=1 Tax=Linum tenue TaxID=586396 RepID=A0AAV0NJH2_9ROSI|nr:unnamed protein product [Linum tenue]
MPIIPLLAKLSPAFIPFVHKGPTITFEPLSGEKSRFRLQTNLGSFYNMKALAHGSCCPVITAISNSRFIPSRRSANSLPCRVSFESFSPSSSKASAFRFPRLRISQSEAVDLQCRSRLLVSAAAADEDSETNSEVEPNNSSDGAATVDIKLPRRSLLVQFTCNDCGERTQRLINRLAYEKGLVFVQCAGCEQYHKLADNLGLIVEYDLREEIKTDPNAEEV